MTLSIPEGKIREWIANKLSSLPAAETFHLIHAEGEELVARGSPEGESTPLELAAQQIAEFFAGEASEHAESFDASQRYKIVAFASAGEELGSQSFRVNPISADRARLMAEEPRWPTEHEPATEKGLLGQTMRHNEQLAQALIKLAHTTVMPLAEENYRLRQHMARLDETHFENVRIREDLITKKHERDLEMKEVEAEIALKEKAFDTAISHFPELAKGLGRYLKLTASSQKGKEVKQSAPTEVGKVLAPRDGAEKEESHGAAVKEMAATLAQIIGKIGGYPYLLKNLPEELHETVDGLLGFQPLPESAEAFRASVKEVVGNLPGSMVDEMISSLEDDPVLFAKLGELAGFGGP